MAQTLIQKRIVQADTIKSKLAQLGYTLTDVDNLYGLTRHSAINALRYPHEPGETAIATVLGINASELWPERYCSKTGKRLSPQPHANYDRLTPIGQRRKLTEPQI